MTLYSPAILSKAVKSASSGAPSSTETGNALCPFLEGLVERPASHSASRRLGLRPSKAPAITSDSTAWGFRPVRLTRSAGLRYGPCLSLSSTIATADSSPTSFTMPRPSSR